MNVPLRNRLPYTARRFLSSRLFSRRSLPSRWLHTGFVLLWLFAGFLQPQGSSSARVQAQDALPDAELTLVATPSIGASEIMTPTQTMTATGTITGTTNTAPTLSPAATMTPSPTPTPTPSPTPSMTASATLTASAPLTLTTPAITSTLTPLGTPATVLITATIWAKASATAQAAATVQAAEALTLTPTPSPTPIPGPDDILDRQINEMIARMSVAERVGQLFIVDFQGSTAGADADIAELIREYHIGGVVLNPQNGNFRNDDPNAPRQIAVLTNQLQALAYNIVLPDDQALDPPEVLLNQSAPAAFNPLQQTTPQIPLLIGIEQNGDGYPGSSLRSGFTTLPPQMALGATWNPELARSVGAIVGRELSAVGVNMLLGPSLDVLDQPRPEPVGGLGIHTFGGDAFWVGKMGQAYVRGVHEGGNGRVATIAGHFPGQGGSDRRPDEEVATIQKSLQELRHTELQPFAAVTQRASSLLRYDGDPAATDGLMSGHVRYSSFQGSRERTPPISLATELETILALDEFATWRNQGGVVMSDALGVPSIRRYYDPTLQEFPRRRVALEAFQAGNDLLYLANFSLDDNWDAARNNIRETILFFRERYTSDPDFAARVDNSLQHILRLKVRMYDVALEEESDAAVAEATTKAPTPLPSPETETTPAPASVADVAGTPTPAPEAVLRAITIPIERVLTGSRALRVLTGPMREEAQSLVGQVAREAVTILSPDPRGLADPLPAAPQAEEKIVIFTDSRTFEECDDCPSQTVLAPNALEEVMLRLYGPNATNQIQLDQVQSITFEELNAVLNDTAPDNLVQQVEEAISEADWLIFAMLDVDVARAPNSDAVKQFLRLRSDRLLGKRIVVLALNAPYFLDSTEISKLTAYLGIYSKTQPFLEAAVRTIFRSTQAAGSPPVAVSGTRYSNLIERLEPDPDQTIELHLLNAGIAAGPTATVEASTTNIQADLAIGDVIVVETGIIVDRNGNPVPDGTQVNFRLIYEGAELALPVDPMPTRQGKARLAITLERSGILRVSARSVEANTSTLIVVNTQGSDAASIEIVMPTPTLAPTFVPTPESVAVNEDSSTVTESGQIVGDGSVNAVPTVSIARRNARVDLLTLSLAGITQLVMLGLLLVVLVRVMPRAMLVYRLLWALMVGWLAYILYGLGLVPGSTWLQMTLYPWGVIPVVFIGMLLPMVWLQLKAD
ncbi:hypothetical protein GC175_22380 [bacterium]|nr:hypothetical protein [bacterium]